MGKKENRKTSESRRETSESIRTVAAELKIKGEKEYGDRFIKLGDDVLEQIVLFGNWKPVLKIDAEIRGTIEKMTAEKSLWRTVTPDLLTVEKYYCELLDKVSDRWNEYRKKTVGFWDRVFKRNNAYNNKSDEVEEAGLTLAKIDLTIQRTIRLEKLARISGDYVKADLLKSSIERNRALQRAQHKVYVTKFTGNDLLKNKQLLEEIKAGQKSEATEHMAATLSMLVDQVNRGNKENAALLKVMDSRIKELEGSENSESLNDTDDEFEAPNPAPLNSSAE